ncbi:leucine-rich repeat domain-containing protein [Flammeovirga aprica]|uniref:Leucine-rich repeat domain-containing protein n=1 Tax=Flammeovirga aprica JL-4 TaxID=694437 RepID=A0A7X9RZC4_9BACT|nr:leucine-rich repeat domain-containing protein [Flammeovirga aprica]NME71538.1 hypothetical protein [Flammeovirga aprica JL-4]
MTEQTCNLNLEKEVIEELEQTFQSYFSFEQNTDGYVIAIKLSGTSESAFNYSPILITEIPLSIASFTYLEVVDLSNNAITELPTFFKELKLLEVLILNNNPVSELPDYIFDLQSLKVLSLENTEIKALPEVLANQSELTHLYLGGSNFIGFPIVLNSIASNIKGLSLNDIELLPPNINDYSSLNYFSAILHNFKNLDRLQGLKTLIIKNSKAVKFPFDFKTLPSLIELRFIDCGKLRELPKKLGMINHIEEMTLDFSGCTSLQGIPETFINFNVTFLYLNGCSSIRFLPSSWDIGSIHALNVNWTTPPKNIFKTGARKLWITGSRFSSIRGIGEMSNLNFCVMTDGGLRTIPEEILNCKNLEFLNISGNKVKHIPEFLKDLPKLKSIEIGEMKL